MSFSFSKEMIAQTDLSTFPFLILMAVHNMTSTKLPNRGEKEKKSEKISTLNVENCNCKISAQISIYSHPGFYSTFNHLYSASSRFLFLADYSNKYKHTAQHPFKEKGKNKKNIFLLPFTAKPPAVLSILTVSNFLPILFSPHIQNTSELNSSHSFPS